MNVATFKSLVRTAQTAEGVRSLVETHWRDVTGDTEELLDVLAFADHRAEMLPGWDGLPPQAERYTIGSEWETNVVNFPVVVCSAA